MTPWNRIQMSTNVKRLYQYHEVLPNFPNAQMNVKFFMTKHYENKSNPTLGENKPNSNPIKPNFQGVQTNANLFAEKELTFRRDGVFVYSVVAAAGRCCDFAKGLS